MSEPEPAMSGISAAFATLARASRFLGAGLQTLAHPHDSRAGTADIAGPHRAKVVGNGLRELDRFLSLLIDEVAARINPPGLPARLCRQRGTASNLRATREAMMLDSPDHDRLLAIGRWRDCLFYCGGVVRRGDSRHAARMTVGWRRFDGIAYSLAIGERLTIDALHLHDVCRFYERVAADLVSDCRAYLANDSREARRRDRGRLGAGVRLLVAFADGACAKNMCLA